MTATSSSRHAELLFRRAMLADRRGDSAASESLTHRAFERAEQCGAAQWAAIAQANLAWLHIPRRDFPGAAQHIGTGLSWASRIGSELIRTETEAQLQSVSAMVSMDLGHLGEARATLRAVIARSAGQAAPAIRRAL